MAVFFSYAFRPLFLFATLYAIVVVPLWVLAWLGYAPMPSSLGAPAWWHAHEMIHGFAAAAIGGFVLTAVATWTNRPPISGRPLVILSALWIVARVSFALPSSSLPVPGVVADLAYGSFLFALMSREVVGARSRRNYKVLLILALLPITNGWFFWTLSHDPGRSMTALLAALWVIILLVNLIGGRIIPVFTRNWLSRSMVGRPRVETSPPTFDRFDQLATALMIGFAVLQLGGGPPRWTAAVGLVTAVSFLVRLSRWQGIHAGTEPLVWVLHLGFAWLPLGFLLLAAADIGLVPRTAATHALTSGAISTMIVAVASRAALGHTNRPLEGHPVLTAAYVLITLAAGCRVAATFGPGARLLLAVSALAWCAGFGCFAWRYVPILTRPSVQRPGLLQRR